MSIQSIRSTIITTYSLTIVEYSMIKQYLLLFVHMTIQLVYQFDELLRIGKYLHVLLELHDVRLTVLDHREN